MTLYTSNFLLAIEGLLGPPGRLRGAGVRLRTLTHISFLSFRFHFLRARRILRPGI